MVGIIICRVLLSCFVTVMVVALIYTNTKAYNMRDIMFHRYYIMDELWLKTGLSNILAITYSNKVVNIKVKCNTLGGTNDNCRVYSAFINDTECATAVKLRDKYNCYYTFYVDEQFDEKEVWNILDTAYKKAEEQRKIDKVVKESMKRSVLEERTNGNSNNY